MKPNLEFRRMHKHGWSCIWLTVLAFQSCFQLSASLVYWSAYVQVRYFDEGFNKTVISLCECGLFGEDSPLQSAAGLVVLPNSDPLACSENTTFTPKDQPWIALIKRGNCSSSTKILNAQREGASAVVIYNIDGRGDDTILMSHSDADDIVAIMIGNILGTAIANLIKNGSDVNMLIVAGNPHGLWFSSRWAYVLSFTFIGITAVTMCYFAFLFIKRMYINWQLRLQQREMKRVTEKAISKLQVRTMRRGDPEVESEDVSCVVCTDSFQRDEHVTVLPCRHLYHKKCIEPWLLEHPTCPMCKFNILKCKIDEESDDQPTAAPANDTFTLTAVTTAVEQHDIVHYNLQTDDPALGRTSDQDFRTHVYENLAFEEQPEIMEHQNINNQA